MIVISNDVSKLNILISFIIGEAHVGSIAWTYKSILNGLHEINPVRTYLDGLLNWFMVIVLKIS